MWIKLRECIELLYGRTFPLKLKGSVYKSYVRPAILYGSEAWCLRVKTFLDRMTHGESNDAELRGMWPLNYQILNIGVSLW